MAEDNYDSKEVAIAIQTEASLQGLEKYRDEYIRIVNDVKACLLCCKCSEVPLESESYFSGCPAGHVICEFCKYCLEKCPEPGCQRSLALECQNNVASKLARCVSLPCKYITYGCNYTSLFHKVMDHQKMCPQRTVVCPHCQATVQLKSFHDHCVEKNCCIKPSGDKDIKLELSHDYMTCDSVRDVDFGEFNLDNDISYKLSSIDVHESQFYVYSKYLASKKHFVFYVMTSNVNDGFQYKMTFSASHKDKKRKREMIFTGPVLRIADAPSADSFEKKMDIKAHESCVYISYEAFKAFLKIEDTEKDVHYNNNVCCLVTLPFSVDIIKDETQE